MTIPAMAYLTTCKYFFLALIFFFVVPSFSSDPDPLQDFCVADLTASPSFNGFPCKPIKNVTSDDFFFSGFTKPLNTSNANGVGVTAANVLAFPGINTLGLSMNNVEFAPGGVNPPHSHPRSTESGVVIEGMVFVGFVSTNNVLYSKVLNTGEMFVIPRGLVHFQWNVGRGKARLITAFNSQLPGSVIVPNTLFGSSPTIPNQVLTKAFRADDSVVNSIKSKFGM